MFALCPMMTERERNEKVLLVHSGTTAGTLGTDFLHRNEEEQDLVVKDILGFETNFWIRHRLPEWPHRQVTESELSEYSH